MLLIADMPLFGQDVPKRIVKRVDVISLLPDTSDGNPESFWKAILNSENEITETFNKIYKREKGIGAEARKEIDEAILLHVRHYRDSVRYDAFLDSIAKTLLIGDKGRVCLYNLENLSLNAFAAPNGNIVIYSGLKDYLSRYKQELLIAIVAHEIAHVMFKHSLVQVYMQKKKERNNNIMAGIAVGLQAFADGMNSATTGKTINNTAYYTSIFNMAKYDTFMYQFKYSREVELQADVVAFRLLDWIGIGGERLKEALRLIASPFEYSSDTDDHYTIPQRIAVLESLESQPRVKSNRNLLSQIKSKNGTKGTIRESSSRSVEIRVGEEIRLKLLSGKDATWTTKDTNVVQINKDGLVKGISTGQAMIWANYNTNDPELHLVNVVNNLLFRLN